MMIQVSKLHLHQRSQILDVVFQDDSQISLSAEFLRVHSPSAEVQGHGKPVLVANKKDVKVTAVQRVGNYAVKLVFDDGHDTGIYSWQSLFQFGRDKEELWSQYLDAIKSANASRDTIIPIQVR